MELPRGTLQTTCFVQTASGWSCIYLMLYHWCEIDVTSCVAVKRRGPNSGMETSTQNIQGVWYHVGFVCENRVGKSNLGKLYSRSDQQREPGALVGN